MKPFTIWISTVPVVRIDVNDMVIVLNMTLDPSDSGWSGIQQREKFFSRGLRHSSPDFIPGTNKPYYPT